LNRQARNYIKAGTIYRKLRTAARANSGIKARSPAQFMTKSEIAINRALAKIEAWLDRFLRAIRL
jgi:hypothetical protein